MGQAFIGINIGSMTIKVVAWDEKACMVYSDYVCHHHEVQKPFAPVLCKKVPLLLTKMR